MQHIWTTIKGLIIAQLGVPVFVLLLCLFGYVYAYLFVDHTYMSYQLTLIFMLVGLMFSVPASLILGFPTLQFIIKRNQLTLPSILFVALFVCVIASIVCSFLSIDGLELLLFSVPSAVIGAIFMWLYFRSKGILD